MVKGTVDVAVSNVVCTVSVCANVQGLVYLNYDGILVPIAGFYDLESAKKYGEELCAKYGWN